jgi:hypothetical protein
MNSNSAPRRPPIPVSEAATASPLDDWRLAAARVERYLGAVDLPAAERGRLKYAALARAARGPGWASGKRATAEAIHALHRLLAEGDGTRPIADDDLMKASSRARLELWLASRTADGPPPVEDGVDGRARIKSTPPMHRVNMSPAGITRRPAPLRWLFRMF